MGIQFDSIVTALGSGGTVGGLFFICKTQWIKEKYLWY